MRIEIFTIKAGKYFYVIVTPHNSFVGDGNRKRLLDNILKKLGEKNNESTFNGNSAEPYLSIS